MKHNIRTKCYLAGIIVSALAILITVITGIRSNAAAPAVLPAPGETAPETHTVVVTKEVEKVVEKEKVITSEMLQEGLNDMGILITQEYCFTQVVDYSDALKVIKTGWSIPGTESGFIVSYDGVVEAGIDFGAVRVEKDEGAMTVTVRIPSAQIQHTVIDYDSFQLHSEKKSVFNPLSVEDFNGALVELEDKAEAMAIEKGILTRGDENARKVIANFIGTMVDTSEYTLNLVSADV